MGLFDLFGARRKEGRRAAAARAKERAGDLVAAVELYVEAGLRDEAARVLLLRADAERAAERRITLCAAAAATAADPEVRRRALARKAQLSLDLLRRPGGTSLRGELSAVARELEQAGEHAQAAEAYALAGDAEGEVRALTAAGAIERLEERLRVSQSTARVDREREHGLARIVDLDRTAERRAALDLAVRAQAARPDERIAELVVAIRARLLRGPIVELEIDGRAERYALGDEVTIGRSDATIVVPSPAVSRRHLRVRREPGGPVVEDLGSRNGTVLAGARLAGAIPVGAGVALELGGEVRCALTVLGATDPEVPGGVAIEVGGERYVAPLGELPAAGFRVHWEVVGEESFIVLRSPGRAGRPFLGEFELAARVELCKGDEIRQMRGGPVVLRAGSGGLGSAGGAAEGGGA